MTIPRAGRWLKLARGKEHLKTLGRILEAILARDQPKIPLSHGYDPQDQSWVCRVGDFKLVASMDAGMVIGDTVQNFRAALDHLIWDLAILDTRSWPNGRTQFPICETKDGQYGYDSPHVQKRFLDSISPAHRSMIEGFQPYITGDNILLLLRRISNEDKHRIVHTVLAADIASAPVVRGFSDCKVVIEGGGLSIIQGPLKPNTTILRLPLTDVGPNPKVDLMFQSAICVAFCDGESVDRVLTKASMVVEEILNCFESELSTPEAEAIRQAADAAHT